MSSGRLEYGKPKGETVKYLNEHCLNIFHRGYVTCKGVLLHEYFTEFGDRIQELDIRPDDVWVCSFPKTGTTWVQEMVWCLVHDVDLQTAEERLSKRFNFVERSCIFDIRGVNVEDSDIKLPPHLFVDSVNTFDNSPSPRFVKTHLPYNLLPQKLQRQETTAKIVYVIRNARDTCLSFFHQYRLLHGYTGSFEQFCELFIDGNVVYGPFFDHIEGFWEYRNNLNVLLLKYEDMKKDLKSVLHKTAKFFNKSLSDEQADKLVDHLSFDSMKKNPSVNRDHLVELHKNMKLAQEDGSLMRQGKVGGWRAMMNPELEKRFDEWEREALKAKAENSLADYYDYTY